VSSSIAAVTTSGDTVAGMMKVVPPNDSLGAVLGRAYV